MAFLRMFKDWHRNRIVHKLSERICSNESSMKVLSVELQISARAK